MKAKSVTAPPFWGGELTTHDLIQIPLIDSSPSILETSLQQVMKYIERYCKHFGVCVYNVQIIFNVSFTMEMKN